MYEKYKFSMKNDSHLLRCENLCKVRNRKEEYNESKVDKKKGVLENMHDLLMIKATCSVKKDVFNLLRKSVYS